MHWYTNASHGEKRAMFIGLAFLAFTITIFVITGW